MSTFNMIFLRIFNLVGKVIISLKSSTCNRFPRFSHNTKLRLFKTWQYVLLHFWSPFPKCNLIKSGSYFSYQALDICTTCPFVNIFAGSVIYMRTPYILCVVKCCYHILSCNTNQASLETTKTIVQSNSKAYSLFTTDFMLNRNSRGGFLVYYVSYSFISFVGLASLLLFILLPVLPSIYMRLITVSFVFELSFEC